METNQPKNNKFEQIDIDNRDKNYSNEYVFNCLVGCIGKIDFDDERNFFNGEKVSFLQRIQYLCHIISHITDIDFLNQALSYLKMVGLIENKDKDLENYLISSYSDGLYSETDITTIIAIFYSLTSRHNLDSKTLKFTGSGAPKPLEINIKNRVIEHNLNEVTSSIRRNNLLIFEDSISKASIIEQKKSIDKWLRSLLRFSLSKDTKFLDLEINYLEKISNHLMEPENNHGEKVFSVKEWATIFYYADETKLLPLSKSLSERIKVFIKKHDIETTFDYFRKEYYNAKKRINVVTDFPIAKLEVIIPFLKSNYNQTVVKVENDIIILKEELLD